MASMCVNQMKNLLSVKVAQQSSSKSPKQQHRNLQWVKIENRLKNIGSPMDHIYACPKKQGKVSYGEESAFLIRPRVGEHVHSFLWQDSFQHQNWGPCSSRSPTSLLMRAAEAGQKKKEKKKNERKRSGYIQMKCGPLYYSWNVENQCISGVDPKQQWRRLSIHYNHQCSPDVGLYIRASGRHAQRMGCNLMYTVAGVVRCILTDWNHCHIYFCKCYKKLHHVEMFCITLNWHAHTVIIICVEKLLLVYTPSYCLFYITEHYTRKL